MPGEIVLNEQEARDLLSKWKGENRVIHLTLDAGLAMAKVVGRIDALTEETAFFSAMKSTYSFGRHNLSQFPLKNCRFEYSDPKDAPEPLRTQLSGYDALLYVFCRDTKAQVRAGVALAVLPIEEYPDF